MYYQAYLIKAQNIKDINTKNTVEHLQKKKENRNILLKEKKMKEIVRYNG